MEQPTEPRSVRARLAAVIAGVAAAALLAGCSAGFDATSTKPYAPSDGILANSGDLRVQNALVVASDAVSSGVVIMTIANRGDRDDELTGISSPDGTVDFTGDGELPAGAAVRLGADTDPSATISELDRTARRDDHAAPDLRPVRAAADRHRRRPRGRRLRVDHAGSHHARGVARSGDQGSSL